MAVWKLIWGYTKKTNKENNQMFHNKVLGGSKIAEAVFGSLKLPNVEYSTTDERTLTILIEAHFPNFTGKTEGNYQASLPSGQ